MVFAVVCSAQRAEDAGALAPARAAPANLLPYILAPDIGEKAADAVS